MQPPVASRPRFPQGYVDHPTKWLSWSQVEQRLAEARHYWICSTRPNGRPHAIPKWAVWVDGRVFFDGSPETRHARNLAANPFVVLHLESGAEAVIVEGTAREIRRPAPELAAKIARAYAAKYAEMGYAPEPSQWDAGGLYQLTPRTVIAWTNFTENPTKFTFAPE